MKRNWVPSLDAEVSQLGFGAMRLPTKSEDIADIDRDAVCRMVDIAFESGVNFFDTAYLYHKGESETALKTALTERYERNSYYLSDKLAAFVCKAPEDMRAMFEKQLSRTGVDYFDFYLLHAIMEARYDQAVKLGAFDFLKDLRERGLIKRLGFSFHSTPDFLERVLDRHDEFEFVLLQINYLDWSALHASEYYRIARERELPIMIMEPIKGGGLASLPPQAAACSDKLATAEGQAEFALRFAGSLDGVFTLLSGMSSVEQVKRNTETFADFRPFSEEEWRLAERVRDEINKVATIPCTACGYCLESCPVQIDIPRIFLIYNEFKRTGVEFNTQYLYSCILENRRADSCVACGACKPNCPQGIDIPTELAAIHPQIPILPLIPREDR